MDERVKELRSIYVEVKSSIREKETELLSIEQKIGNLEKEEAEREGGVLTARQGKESAYDKYHRGALDDTQLDKKIKIFNEAVANLNVTQEKITVLKNTRERCNQDMNKLKAQLPSLEKRLWTFILQDLKKEFQDKMRDEIELVLIAGIKAQAVGTPRDLGQMLCHDLFNAQGRYHVSREHIDKLSKEIGKKYEL